MNQIAAACSEQSQGIGLVNEALQRMDKVTQSNAAAAEQTAASAEELNTQGSHLHDIVRDLLEMVHAKIDDGRPVLAKTSPTGKALTNHSLMKRNPCPSDLPIAA